MAGRLHWTDWLLIALVLVLMVHGFLHRGALLGWYRATCLRQDARQEALEQAIVDSGTEDEESHGYPGWQGYPGPRDP